MPCTCHNSYPHSYYYIPIAERKFNDGPDANSIDANAITITVVTVAAALVLLLLLAAAMGVFYVMMRTEPEIKPKADIS